MSSRITSITASAVIAGLGTLALLGPASGAEASTDGPVTTDSSAAAAHVTGTISGLHDPTESYGVVRVEPGLVVHTEGMRELSRWSASDPRLSGIATRTADQLRHALANVVVESASYVLETEGGRWSGVGTRLGDEPYGGTDTILLEGSGAHDGLTAYVVIDHGTFPTSFDAAIFPGEMPAAP